jgi:heme oxygenase (biliverdin-producing, ferredoxin)
VSTTLEKDQHQGLATQLREGTQKAHTMAENTDFIKGFLKGVLDRESYRKFSANHYFVYATLEEELTKHQNHPVLSKIFFPQLWRQKSLEQDMVYFYGSDWRSQVQPSAACKNYTQHMQEVSAIAPELLVAHAYTRYMGDLSGGQILKNIAKKALGLQENEGLAFYDFDQIKNHGEFKKKYRNALDTLPVDAATADRIVTEANQAFHLNMEMFRELKGNWLLPLIRFIWGWIVSRFQTKPSVNVTSDSASTSA